MKKRLMCLSLACVFVFSLLVSTPVFAAVGDKFTIGNFTYYVRDEVSVAVWSTAAGSLSGTVNIPSTVSDGTTTYTVKTIAYNAFHDQTGLTGVTMPDTIIAVGVSAFYGCHNLETVTFSPNLDGEMTGSFYDCRALKSVTIPAGVDILYKTFINCTNLTSVTFLGANTDPRDYGSEGVFDGHNAKLVVTAPVGSKAAQYATSKGITVNPPIVVSFESGEFKYSVISGTDNVKVTGFSSTSEKSGAYSLPSTVVNNSKSYTVTQIAGIAFADQNKVTLLTLPDTVTSIGYQAFMNMEGLTDFVMPDSVTTIGYNTFYACSNLENVKLSKNLTGAMSGTFAYCYKLKSCVIPDGVKELSKTFMYCHIINTVVIPASVTTITGDDATDAGQRLFSTFNNGTTGAPTEPGFTVLCAAGSAAATYMAGKSWNYRVADFSKPIALKKPKFGDDKKVFLDVINTSETDVTEDLDVICAIYNRADNTLLDVVIVPINGGVSNLKVDSYETIGDVQYDSATMYAKSFVWSQDNITPLVNSETLI